MIEILIKYTLTPAVIISIISYTMKKIFDVYLQRQINFHKLELDKTLSSHNSELEHRIKEYEIKFSRLHEKQANVVAELYQKLIILELSFNSFIAPLQFNFKSDEENADETQKSVNDFFNYFEINELYFPEDLGEIIRKMTNKFKIAWNQRLSAHKNTDPNDEIQSMDSWNKAWEILQEEIPPLKKELRKHFREILGV